MGYLTPMSVKPTTLERAFALARSGEYTGVAEIKAKLKAEGFTLNQMEGPSLMRQLRDLCIAARQDRPPEDGPASEPHGQTPRA